MQSSQIYPPWTFPNTSKSTETYFSPASEDIANNITSVRTKREVQQMFKLQIIINKSAWRRRHLQGWNPTLLQRPVRHVTPVTFLSVWHDGQITVVVVTGWWDLKHCFILVVWHGFLFICLTSVFKSIICRICQMPLIRQKTSRNLLSKADARPLEEETSAVDSFSREFSNWNCFRRLGYIAKLDFNNRFNIM